MVTSNVMNALMDASESCGRPMISSGTELHCLCRLPSRDHHTSTPRNVFNSERETAISIALSLMFLSDIIQDALDDVSHI